MKQMTHPSPLQLVFLPGIGLDYRLFKYQTAVFPNSFVAEWIDPLPGEHLEQYSVRLAETIRDRTATPVIIIGLSLGGMAAPYVARELDAAGCILLATVRKPSQFPRRYYADWLLKRLCPPIQLLQLIVLRCCVRFLLRFPRLIRGFADSTVIRSFVEMPFFRFNGLARMMFDWAYRRRQPEETDAIVFDKPTLHVHGTNDWLLPIRRTNPDIRIEGGGHELVLTHPNEINEIIERFVNEI